MNDDNNAHVRDYELRLREHTRIMLGKAMLVAMSIGFLFGFIVASLLFVLW